jgi:formate-dependent nitrite reductase cytochrome c552 subunit
MQMALALSSNQRDRPSRLGRILRHILLCLTLIVAAGAGASAQEVNRVIKVDRNFDHSRTNFALEGAHQSVSCETCHKGAVFKGVPTVCESCHDGSMAKGKSPDHPKTANTCAQCHGSTSWAKVRVDHTPFTSGCFTCHNGDVATGKPKTHIPSGTECASCHRVSDWQVEAFDHTRTQGTCITCHDRFRARGSPSITCRRATTASHAT